MRRQGAPLAERCPNGSPAGCRGAAPGPDAAEPLRRTPTLGLSTWGGCKDPSAGLVPPFCTPARAPRARLQPQPRCSLFLAVATGRCTESAHSRTAWTRYRTARTDSWTVCTDRRTLCMDSRTACMHSWTACRDRWTPCRDRWPPCTHSMHRQHAWTAGHTATPHPKHPRARL